MNTSILPTILGSLLAMAPIVDSTFSPRAELKRPALAENSLVVHEWGTFTALQGSNGLVQNGMQHEEEALPAFVHARDLLNEEYRDPNVRPCPRFCKGFEPGTIYRSDNDADHLTVTQKMETPVLYFYSKGEVKNAHVTANFPQGVISQYFPEPVSFTPSFGNVETLAHGQVDFAFDIAAENAVLDIPAVDAESVYAPSRNVNSNYIQTTKGENEKLIFYRGLGDFSTSISIRSDLKGLFISNTSKDLTTQAGLLYFSDGNNVGGFYPVKAIAPGGEVYFSPSQVQKIKRMHHGDLIAKASEVLVTQLEQSGLYHEEAVSMVNTWTRSYFKTKGLRFLHILSMKETENLLPLTMTPQPTELVRTLVGRIEILTYQEEQELITQIAQRVGIPFPIESLGRLAEPKLRRIRELVPAGFATDIDQLIAKSLTM